MKIPTLRRLVWYITILLLVSAIDTFLKSRFFALTRFVIIRDVILMVITIGLVFDREIAPYPRTPFVSLVIF